MKRSQDRILTTHVGSLARPKPLLDQLRAAANGGEPEAQTLAATVKTTVAETVRGQAEAGIDILTDGEMSKSSFIGYIRGRLDGFEVTEPPPGPPPARGGKAERAAFPEYYEQYAKALRAREYAVPFPEPPLVCRGPVRYRPQAVQTDIANLKAALQGVKYEEVFMPAVTPRTQIKNEYYKTDEEFRLAYAEALREEYRTILDAGFLLQIDDPAFATQFGDDPAQPLEQRRRAAEQFAELFNYAVRGLPQDRVRFHSCYGTNIAPRVYEAPLGELVDLLLKVNAGAYSIEACNPRHAADWHVWERVKLPEGRVIIPGFISHTTTLVEHPAWIADMIVSYAGVVGRENLIAGADCGFSSLAMYTPEILPSVVWAKFRSLAEGAALASKRLYG
ncbi:MAG TPA: cobalamin-independent methionine synthase II family protein [Dehalococcoidia bacterium]|nr:cobalamin-independent methionine synthase II family protein [Dehalococcoidia bacterium]